MDLVEAKGLVPNRHPWELARTAFFVRLAMDAIGRTGPVRVLDVGCGDGWFSRQLFGHLPPSSELVGWDIALDDPRLEVFASDLPVGMSLTNTDPVGEFDLILCMDVLEHVPDDRALLTDLKERYLRSGGHLVVSVPAWMALFSKHDLALKHYRRYTPRRGRDLMRSVGLEIVRKGGLFHGLAAVRALQVARWGRAEPLDDPGSFASGDEAVGVGGWNAPALVTTVVSTGLRAEGVFSRLLAASRIELPGLSWWVLCQKP